MRVWSEARGKAAGAYTVQFRCAPVKTSVHVSLLPMEAGGGGQREGHRVSETQQGSEERARADAVL